jgi:hypothetical protein
VEPQWVLREKGDGKEPETLTEIEREGEERERERERDLHGGKEI